MCGKNSVTRTMEKAKRGSPPRVREEQRHAYDGKGEKGITPACAGRTGTDSGLYAGGRDHPRVCGKNKTTHNVIRVSRGSPPRVREEL